MPSITTGRRHNWTGRTAAASFVALLALLAPGPSPAAAGNAAPAQPASSIMEEEPYEVTWTSKGRQNGNADARCRSNQAYLKLHYSGDYKVFVRLGLGRWDDYADYEELRGKSFYYSGALTPSKRATEGYLYLPDQHDPADMLVSRPVGVLGVKVVDPDTGEWLYENLSDIRLLCGYDFEVYLKDNV
ncbi:hypothetical protein QLQ12_39095 [Actinoplanes sp. NEAU-A12]|uniref:Uncharacterized protein n=1 Tax=Actinoplanes sandaracinus TaxID=3045177 RepID=A0ABT6WYC5_9ACTN|nr:hypothetical protein [Actinoplanes sandaracinus]MDI6104615.1 hypothetical protein [Actinoplanes sandaracinus]